MRIETIRKEYFRWLRRFVCGEKQSKFSSYDKLLLSLHNTEFTWTMPMDSNRAGDGKGLRLRFGSEKRIPRETGYTNEQLHKLSNKIVHEGKGFFGEAYNVSYTRKSISRNYLYKAIRV